MRKNGLIYILYACSIILSAGACREKVKEKKQYEGKKELFPVYNIPAPKAISDAEKKTLQVQCGLFYDTILAPSGFNGGIIVAKGGNIIFEKYRGLVNLDGGEPITASTPLHIASVSKTFTAMTILKLQEEGKLNINDSLTKYFPDFNYPGVTVKTLLNHRSGLPNYLYFMQKAGWNIDSAITNEDVLKWLILKKNELKDIIPADTKFTYCNTNFALLALIIEKVSGKKYPEYMKQNIFDPMGMKNTFVQHSGNTRLHTKSFDWRGREIPDNFLDDVYGDKNIYSTPQDLLRWDRILSDTLFLSAKSLESAYIPYSNERPGIKNYGLGWRMNIYDNGKKIIFHTGWWHGNTAILIRLLDTDATIIVISNRYTRSVFEAKYLANIFTHYFDAETIDPETILPEALPEVFPAASKEELKADKKSAGNIQMSDSLAPRAGDTKIPAKIIKKKRKS